MIGRREVLAAGAIGVALAFPAPANACSISVDRRERFSDRACRQAIEAWVDLLNQAPQMTLDQVSEAVDEMSVSLDSDMVWDALGERTATETGRDYLFYKEFRLSGGRLDTRPIRIDEVNLIRRLRNRATYQFTLERYSFHPADPEGCNGMFTHGEFWGEERDSYLATFWNNRLQSVKPFPEWYLEERS